MSDDISNPTSRKRQKTNHLLVQDCLHSSAENVNIENVYIGNNIRESNSERRNSRTYDPKSNDDNLRSSKSEKEGTITSELRNLYQRITLPSLPWVEKADLSIQYYTKLQLECLEEESMSKIIELHNLFETVDGKNPRRILIESQPGYGKTTLVHKIISDWVHEEKYLASYKFAFLVILKHFKSKTLKDEVIQIINDKDSEVNNVWEIINSDESLLILDGLDEVNEHVRGDILEILYDGRNEYKMTIITTSRIGLSQLKRDEINKIYKGVSLKTDFWCKKITILGISKKDQEKFLRNFVDDEDENNMLSTLLHIIKYITNNRVDSDEDDCDTDDDFAEDDDNVIYDSNEEMFKSPLMLILLIYVTREENETKIKTRTDLYKQFVDYIIRRSISKNRMEVSNVINFSLFEPSVSEYKSIFYNFGKMCWEHILNDELQFTSNENIEAVHQLGLLLKHEVKKKFEIITHYEGLHLTILEFAASAFLREEFRNNQSRLPDSLIEKIVDICIKKRSTSLVIPFLCGLLGNDVAPFFDQLSQHHACYWMTQGLLESILRECEMNGSIMEYFTKIIPPVFNRYDPKTILAVVNEYSQNTFDILNLNWGSLLEITNPLYVRVLLCDVFFDINSSPTNVLQAAKNIECEHLIFYLLHDLPRNMFRTALEIFFKISASQKTLRLAYMHAQRYSWDNRFNSENCVSNCIGAKFDLVVEIFKGDLDVKTIVKIIEYNRVSNLTIFFHEKAKIFVPDIYRLISTVNSLSSVYILNDKRMCEVSLNLDMFTDSAGKSLKSLFLYNVRTQCNAGQNSNHCVESFSIHTIDNKSTLVSNANAILSMVPSTLHCDCGSLKELSNYPNASSWDGWNSVTELTLTLNAFSTEEHWMGFNGFAKFKKLKVLSLELTQDCRDTQLVTSIVESCKFLTLNQLEIRWLNGYYYEDIIVGIQNLVQQNKITCVDGVQFANVWDKPISKIGNCLNFATIKSALQCDFKVGFYFVFCKWGDLWEFVEKYKSDLLHLNLKYEFHTNKLRCYDLPQRGFHPYQEYHKLSVKLC